MDRETKVQQEIRDIAGRLYDGSIADAFRHWAMACLVVDQEPTEEDIQEYVSLDGPDDLGIDGYYVDEENARLILIQSKYSDEQRSSLRRGTAQEFRAAAESMRDEQYVIENGNPQLREAHPVILETILDDRYSIFLGLATNRGVGRSAGAYARGAGSEPWSFEYQGEAYRKDVKMEVMGPDDLKDYRDRLRRAAFETPTVVLSVPRNMFHEVSGEFRAAQATVLARDVAEAYEEYRGAIFRLDVRGPLGSNKVNKEIKKSLEEDTFRKNFHLLNNGLTVLCDYFKYDEDRGKLTISDFQVVNGCQTTYSLNEYRNKLDESVLLKLTVVEPGGKEGWAIEIARSTNTQTTVKAEDFRTLDEIQEKIARKFAELQPPWLYERKRGEKKFQRDAERRAFKQRYGTRKISMREVGKNTLSFLGHPCMAKYDLRRLFDLEDPEGRPLYEQIFSAETTAVQLLLPTRIARQVKEREKEISQTLAGETPRDSSGLSAELEKWLPYARDHLVGLIGEWLRTDPGYEGKVGGLLSPVVSEELLQRLEEWFDKGFEAALDAICHKMDEEAKEEPIANVREFFRSTENYKGMCEWLRRRRILQAARGLWISRRAT